MASNTTAFSTNLQTLRKKRGVTQDQLANHLGVSPQAVSKWENGSYQQDSNSAFYCIDTINQDGVEKGYGINQSCVCMYISLLLNADVIIHPPCGYQMQSNTRRKSWFDRNEVEKMLKDERENGKTI